MPGLTVKSRPEVLLLHSKFGSFDPLRLAEPSEQVHAAMVWAMMRAAESQS